MDSPSLQPLGAAEPAPHRPPTPQPSRANVLQAVRLLFDGLWLRPQAYAAMGRVRNPFVEGLFLIVVVGLIVAILQLIGTGLAWLSAPPVSAIKDATTRHLLTMPFYGDIASSREALQQFQQTYDQMWNVLPYLFGYPSPQKALVGLVMTPLWLLVYWLVYGIVAYAIARLLNGQGSLGQTLGATSLAFAPQLLYGVGVLPFVAVGGVVATWTLLCQYMALRTVHGLTWQRAALAAVLPGIIWRVLWLLLALVGLLVFASLARGGA